jgi:hypothetical protein
MSCTAATTLCSGYPQFDVDTFTGRAIVRERWHVTSASWVSFFAGLFPTTTVPGTSIITALGGVWDMNPAFRVSSVHVEPYAGERSKTDSNSSYFGYGVGPVYDYWVFDITYEIPEWEDASGSGGDPIPYIKHDWRIGSRMIAVPHDSWRWVSAGESPANPEIDADIDIGIQNSVVTHVLKWPKITNPPFANIRSLVNTVNSADVTWRTGTAIEETLLFRGADVTESDQYGLRVYDMSYFFEECVGRKDALTGDPAGWNHFWRDESGHAGWYKAENTQNDSGNSYAFATGSFDALFGL